ncbi:KilA-N domain-containing protein [Vibrio vulnificus]|uniref:KilA-N domain-containing protein n=1 Tax=Vibrio vulnificus TaxID=672 RepID=UPI00159420F5|nr:KilA-N domain-containing protein [Vibrio vulnificus]NVC72624.1 KilA-N domain-containing protein [Vibrio vulnificus]
MKSNVILNRQFFDVAVPQKTENEFFNVTALLDYYNNAYRYEKGTDLEPLPEKSLDKFWGDANHLGGELTQYLVATASELDDNFKPPSESEFKTNNELAKKLGLAQTGRGRYTGGTWCHPYLFVRIAQWISPAFHAKCNKWIADSLLMNRAYACSGYSELTTAASKFKPSWDTKGLFYMNLGTKINEHLFGEHVKNIRQYLDKTQLQDLTNAQVLLKNMIDMDVINSEEDLFNMIEKLPKSIPLLEKKAA